MKPMSMTGAFKVIPLARAENFLDLQLIRVSVEHASLSILRLILRT